MYGLINVLTAVEGERERLAKILMEASRAMPGCKSYVAARDLGDANRIWVTEVWESRSAHEASLQSEAVRAAIAKGRALIAGMERVAETEPL